MSVDDDGRYEITEADLSLPPGVLKGEILDALDVISQHSPDSAQHHHGRARLDNALAAVAARVAMKAAKAADLQARRLVWATWVLAVATLCLVASTIVLAYITAKQK